MELEKLLYPRGVRQWFGIPLTFPDGTRQAYVKIEGRIFSVFIEDKPSGRTMTFYAKFTVREEDDYEIGYFLPLVNINHERYIDVISPEKIFSRDMEDVMVEAKLSLRPKLAVFLNGVYKYSVTPSFNYETRKLSVGSLTNVRDYDSDKNVFENETDVLSLKFELFEQIHPTAVFSISKKEIRAYYQDKNLHLPHKNVYSPEELKIALPGNSTMTVSYLPEYDLFDFGVTLTIPDAYWKGIQKIYEQVFSIPETKGIVENWVPIELYNSMAASASRIIMALYPTQFPKGNEELVLMYRYNLDSGKREKRETINGSTWVSSVGRIIPKPPPLTWMTEINTLQGAAYEKIEQRFRELANRNIVTLSNEEVSEMERLFVQLKQFRQKGKINCRICATPTNLYDPDTRNFYCSDKCQGVDYYDYSG